MRATLNAILAFIGAESLTDEEFNSLPEDLDMEVPNEVYNSLAEILEAREYVTNMIQRLKFYYMAKGQTVSRSGQASGVEASPVVSNVWAGSKL